jgi:hypothetical protein
LWITHIPYISAPNFSFVHHPPTRCQSTQIIMAHHLSQEGLAENSHSSATQATSAAPLDPSPHLDASQLNPYLELSQVATVSSALFKDANKESENRASFKFPDSQPAALQFQEGEAQSQGTDTDSSHSRATSSSQGELQKDNSQRNVSLNDDVRHPMVERMLVQPFGNVPYGKEQIGDRAMTMPGAAGQQVRLGKNEQLPPNGPLLERQATQGLHGVPYPMGAPSQNEPEYDTSLVPIPPEPAGG